MTFPLNPANNSETIVDGITYRYSSTDNAWTRIAKPLTGTTSTFRIENTTTAFSTQSGALQVTGGVGIQGDLYVGGVLNAPSLQRGGQCVGFGYSGSLGFTGSQGFAGSAGFDGSVGFTGSRGETGFTGSQGNAGTQGNAGFAGSLGFAGSRGFTGSAGFFGSTGFAGSQGFTGFTGSRGCAGTQGNTGFAGSVGFTGSQGFAGSAGFFGSTGFVGSQGVSGFTGSQGDPGESVRIIGSTSTATTIAFNSINPVPTKGDGVIVTFNGRLWVYTVSGPVGGYTDVGAIVGPQGCRGFSGSSGFAGSGGGLGFTGSRGFDGSQGVTGFVGSQGFVGFTGSRGEAGTAGNTGFAGSAGNNGFAGSRGFDGSQGVTGFVGSQGFVGFTGSQGNAGTTGATGFTGSASTVPGFTGSQGVGFTGSAGAPGAAGVIASSTTSTFTILNNTNSTSTTTGALVVQGGVGIGRDVVIGGGLLITNDVSGFIQVTTSTFALNLSGPRGSGNRIVPSNPLLNLGANDFTIEFWIRPSELASFNTPLSLSVAGNVVLRIDSGWNTLFGSVPFSTQPIAINTWYHFSASRSGGNGYIHINGVQYLASANSSNYSLDGGSTFIGNYNNNSNQEFIGLMSNLRVTRGRAQYAQGSTFTPSRQLTTGSGVVLLTGASATVTDLSTGSTTFTYLGYSSASTTSFSYSDNIPTGTSNIIRGTTSFTNTATSTSTNTGALTIAGGVGISRDVVIGGTVVGGGIRTTSSATPPANPTVGDVWYNTDTDDLYRFTSDGISGYWLDIIGPSIANSSDVSQFNTTQSFGMRNRLINSAMSIDQRNVGASQSIVAGAALAYTVDRWYAYSTGASVTGQRVAGPGALQHVYQFTGAAGNTAIGFGQRIETVNCYDLNDSVVTLSAFLANSLLGTVTWTAFYANTTDTFGTLASPTRTQIATGSWTVSSTMTRYATNIVIPALAKTGIEIVFTVGAQISGTWQIGAVQLEPGTVATPFERRPIGTELQLCYRYYEIMAVYTVAKGGQYDSNGWIDVITYSEKRIVPIITTSVAMSQVRFRTNRAVLTSAGAVDGGSAFINAEL